MINLILFIVILGTLVLVHELGHFLAAKKQGVRVDEFGFGLPPRVFGIKFGETLYSLNLIPLGGFVKLFGEEYHEIKNSALSKRAFVNKKPWQKVIIIIAGVIGNFILGWGLLSFLFTQGIPVPTDKVIVEKVVAKSPAFTAGLKENDVIKEFLYQGEKQELKSSTDLIALSKKFGGKEINLVVERDQNEIVVLLTPRANPPKDQGPLGVVITSFVVKKYLWYQAPFYSLIESFSITRKIASELIKTLFLLMTFQKPSVDVAGPIGIAKYAGDAFKFGKNALLELVALLSFNLAIVNILPFPALDGGRLVFVMYEWIARKKVNKNIEKYTNLVGILILISLGILITVNDIIKLYK